jgi:SNF2 family DNA or RNA helicase
MICKPHNYQIFAIEHIIANPFCGLFMGMGTGKTFCTTAAINQLMYEDMEISKVLIVAPKRVAQNVWTDEIEKWDQFKHIKASVVLGDARQRVEALKRKADVYIINRENIPWLVRHYQSAWPFDMVVIDELSSFKSPDAERFRSLKAARPFMKRVVGLTGTPAPNGLIDLWSQVYLLDRGARLYDTVSAFRVRYFSYDQYKRKYNIHETTEQAIYDKIGDICISMKTRDYLELPERIEIEVPVKLSAENQAKYDDFEKERIMEYMNPDTNQGGEITALNAAALTGKLLQFANGAIYDSEKDWHTVHDEKLEALDEIIEQANGKPVLVFYNYKHDLERISKRFKIRELKKKEDVAAWNTGKIPILCCHPQSAGHGLNLQAGGHIIVWFGNTWSLEAYEQANARLDRQGQIYPVTIYRLIAMDTVDQDVIAALRAKSTSQEALMFAVKARIEKYNLAL